MKRREGCILGGGARRKLGNPINAVKSKIDGETTEFRGATNRFALDLVADRSSGREPVKLCSWDPGVALRPTYRSRVFARLAHSKASVRRRSCVRVEISRFAAVRRRRIVLFHTCDRHLDTRARPFALFSPTLPRPPLCHPIAHFATFYARFRPYSTV